LVLQLLYSNKFFIIPSSGDPPQADPPFTHATRDPPVKAVIPFNKKVDTLFFLHSAAWFGEFKYVLHYADGKDVTITMDSKNMTDWAAEPKASFPAEEGTYTTVAETVPNPQFKHGSFYRTEWSAPSDRRAVELKSIEFINSGDCIPILIAITGVIEW
jgi:hypothetical protein